MGVACLAARPRMERHHTWDPHPQCEERIVMAFENFGPAYANITAVTPLRIAPSRPYAC